MVKCKWCAFTPDQTDDPHGAVALHCMTDHQSEYMRVQRWLDETAYDPYPASSQDTRTLPRLDDALDPIVA